MRLFKIWISILFFLPVLVQAQPYLSKNGRFQLAEKSGCAPFSVSVTVLAPNLCNGANPCAVDFEGTLNFQALVVNHTYTTPGNYWLVVLFQGSVLDSLQIQVFNNVAPTFELYTCSLNQVQVNITDTNYQQYVIDYNDGSPVVVVPSGSLAKDTHAFATPGNKNISVRGRNVNAADNCNLSTQPFLAQAVLPPLTIDLLTVLSSTEIQLDFTGQANVLYRLEISNNSPSTFQFVRSLYNISTTTITGLQTDSRYYCFRIAAFDPCNGTTAYSNTICSADFDLTLQNNNNRLTWATSNAGVTDYSLNRDAAPFANVPAANTNYDDGNVVCNTDYCYQLIHNYGNGSRSISLSKCGTAFSSDVPTPPANITAQVTGGGVDLLWTQDPAFTASEYTIFRGVSGNPFSIVGTTAVQSFTDAAYTTGGNFCYRITYRDVCNSTSPPGSDTCPIRLSGNLQSDNSINLSWSDYTGWENGVLEYTVEKYNSSGNLLSTTTVNGTTFLDDVEDLTNQQYVYIVYATANDGGLSQSISNTFTIIKEPNLFYPTAFTPNGDNLNDEFKVFGQFISSIEMKIFNRWGEQLYGSSDINLGWDGTYKGNDMPEGTYAFVADITDFSGREFTRSGSVVLLRKK